MNSDEQKPLSTSHQTKILLAEEQTLLADSHKNDHQLAKPSGPVPPDGGCRAYMVVLGSFLCNGFIFGTINSGGIIFNALQKMLTEEGVENPASQASITLSLAIGTTFFLSILSGVLTDKLGIRFITITGGIIATLGMYLSSLTYTQPLLLTLTMGLIFGVGASLAYTPSLVILGHYFSKRMGIVNGIVTAGSSVFTVIIAALLQYTVDNYGLQVTFQMLSVMMSALILSGIVFKPLLVNTPSEKPKTESSGCGAKCKSSCGEFINFDIWKKKKYVIWTLAVPSALFGYFVPYVHLKTYCSLVLGEEAKTEVVIQVLGASSGIGRLAFGLIADRNWVDKIFLQQLSFFCIGTLTMFLTLANSLESFIAIVFFMGLFDGCFISLLGPIAFDIVGPSGASQAIGCLLALCAIPLTLGPFIAGVLFDKLGSYFVPFLCAGLPPILGCFALCAIKLVKDEDPIEKDPENQIEANGKKNVLLNEDCTGNMRSHDCGIQQADNGTRVDTKKKLNIQHESSL